MLASEFFAADCADERGLDFYQFSPAIVESAVDQNRNHEGSRRNTEIRVAPRSSAAMKFRNRLDSPTPNLLRTAASWHQKTLFHPASVCRWIAAPGLLLSSTLAYLSPEGHLRCACRRRSLS